MDAVTEEARGGNGIKLRSAALPTRASISFDTSPPTLDIPDGVTVKDYITGKNPAAKAMHLLFANGNERSEALIFQFAQLGVPQQVFRWTGWAGKIGDRIQELETVADAFRGVNGFHLFGGTQVRDLTDMSLIPSTGDIPILLKRRAIEEENPNFVLIGIIPKVSEEPTVVPGIGLVLRIQKEIEAGKEAERVTVINTDQNVGLLLQPDTNGHYEWIDEIKESLRQSIKLADKGWGTNLVVFGGSTTEPGALKLRNVEQELVWWSQAKSENPDRNINILLIKGSGGVADKYAHDEAWLAKHPFVKVADLNVESIRSKLSEMQGVRLD